MLRGTGSMWTRSQPGRRALQLRQYTVHASTHLLTRPHHTHCHRRVEGQNGGAGQTVPEGMDHSSCPSRGPLETPSAVAAVEHGVECWQMLAGVACDRNIWHGSLHSNGAHTWDWRARHRGALLSPASLCTRPLPGTTLPSFARLANPCQGFGQQRQGGEWDCWLEFQNNRSTGGEFPKISPGVCECAVVIVGPGR